MHFNEALGYPNSGLAMGYAETLPLETQISLHSLLIRDRIVLGFVKRCLDIDYEPLKSLHNTINISVLCSLYESGFILLMLPYHFSSTRASTSLVYLDKVYSRFCRPRIGVNG